MLTVKADRAILEKLNKLLKEEGEGACVRLREYRRGLTLEARTRAEYRRKG